MAIWVVANLRDWHKIGKFLPKLTEFSEMNLSYKRKLTFIEKSQSLCHIFLRHQRISLFIFQGMTNPGNITMLGTTPI